MTPRTLTMAALAVLVVGVGLMLLFDTAVTLVVSVVLLFAYLVLGVFAIAAPEHLGELGDRDDSPGD